VRTVLKAVRRGIATFVLRVRQRGRSAVLRAARITGASVAAYLVAEALGLRYPPPLIAALTALLVVQATLSGTLINGVQRVFSVVAGVALAMLQVRERWPLLPMTTERQARVALVQH
jgi:hypothetical protein